MVPFTGIGKPFFAIIFTNETGKSRDLIIATSWQKSSKFDWFGFIPFHKYFPNKSKHQQCPHVQSVLLPRFYVNRSPISQLAIHNTIKTFVIFSFRYLFKMKSRADDIFQRLQKGKNWNQQKRPLLVALATETDKDVDKNSCRNNQATEHGNKYDKNTRGSLFHLHRFGRIVTYCIKWNIIVVFAFGLCFYQEVLFLQIVQSYHQTADVLFEM